MAVYKIAGKIVSIKTNKDFKRVYGKGKTKVTPYFVVYWNKNRLPYSRLGIAVSKKIGGAVVRNRAKRVLKEAYRLLPQPVKTGYDFILVARVKTPMQKSFFIKDKLHMLLLNDGMLKI